MLKASWEGNDPFRIVLQEYPRAIVITVIQNTIADNGTLSTSGEIGGISLMDGVLEWMSTSTGKPDGRHGDYAASDEAWRDEAAF